MMEEETKETELKIPMKGGLGEKCKQILIKAGGGVMGGC